MIFSTYFVRTIYEVRDNRQSHCWKALVQLLHNHHHFCHHCTQNVSAGGTTAVPSTLHLQVFQKPGLSPFLTANANAATET